MRLFLPPPPLLAPNMKHTDDDMARAAAIMHKILGETCNMHKYPPAVSNNDMGIIRTPRPPLKGAG